MSNYVLEVQNGKYQGKRVRLNDLDSLVGRDSEAKIRIGSTEVSRRHCQLTLKPDGILVTDLGSANGTFVNGVPIDVPTLMAFGDTLTVGPMQMKLLGEQRTQSKSASAPPPEGKLTDDEIAAWLTDDAIPISPSDTAIIDSPKEAKPAAPPRTPEPQQLKRKFRSIAEEAQEIIRRHLESQQSAG